MAPPIVGNNQFTYTRSVHRIEINSSLGKQKALYLENGKGNRSQIWSEVSSKVILLVYIAIAK